MGERGQNEVDSGEESAEGIEIDDAAVVDETPELMHPPERTRQHGVNAYTIGYDSDADTRVGIGNAARRTPLSRLIRLNEGRHQSDGNHSSREAARDKKRITQSLCSALDVSEYQQREAVSTMSRLNLDQFGQQKGIEKVALGVIAFVVDRDRRQLFLNGRDPDAIDWSAVDVDTLPDRLRDHENYPQLAALHDVPASMPHLVRKNIKRLTASDEPQSTDSP